MTTTLFPSIQPSLQQSTGALSLYREAAWDFQAAQPVFKNGNPVYVTGKEAVKVWCWKALLTQRKRYEIYSWDFGCEAESLIGQNFSEEAKQAEAARYVREALEVNPYITRISDLTVGFDDGRLTISAAVYTIYGEVNVNV